MRVEGPVTPLEWGRFDRVVRWLGRVGVAGVVLLGVETVVISSPTFLIEALYHSRENNFNSLDSMPPAKRAKTLERMCWALQYFRYGSPSNPYDIPHKDDCAKAAP